jgi:hypothetical protein
VKREGKNNSGNHHQANEGLKTTTADEDDYRSLYIHANTQEKHEKTG